MKSKGKGLRNATYTLTACAKCGEVYTIARVTKACPACGSTARKEPEFVTA